METVKNKEFVDAKFVAKRYKTKPLQIYEWVKAGEIPSFVVFRVGRKLLFDLKKIEEWENGEK